ncbi:hypothetical protein M501DRAFT_989253 [Patellaria atrata CBS 101060]|uniref:Uncharacterized protein n=1 Tax=Patellaria atrata CBS 101060 TaxID=1346257 RepID=A0A9P4S2D2_9PEZI|nr:hypothetical protein M501DRAFT_989253 [Patellaria atrata CBS 101060]
MSAPVGSGALVRLPLEVKDMIFGYLTSTYIRADEEFNRSFLDLMYTCRALSAAGERHKFHSMTYDVLINHEGIKCCGYTLPRGIINDPQYWHLMKARKLEIRIQVPLGLPLSAVNNFRFYELHRDLKLNLQNLVDIQAPRIAPVTGINLFENTSKLWQAIEFIAAFDDNKLAELRLLLWRFERLNNFSGNVIRIYPIDIPGEVAPPPLWIPLFRRRFPHSQSKQAQLTTTTGNVQSDPAQMAANMQRAHERKKILRELGYTAAFRLFFQWALWTAEIWDKLIVHSLPGLDIPLQAADVEFRSGNFALFVQIMSSIVEMFEGSEDLLNLHGVHHVEYSALGIRGNTSRVVAGVRTVYAVLKWYSVNRPREE